MESPDNLDRPRVGLVYDERMCLHATPRGESHPENPERIRAIWRKLESEGIPERCVVLNAKEAEDEDIATVHTKGHIKLIRHISSKVFDSRRQKIAGNFNSIYFNKGSSEAAYLAAGSVIEVSEKVAGGDLNSAIAIVRPPGHHAEPDEAMGFCLFNNVAITANVLLNERPELGIKKILIVDWDVHHGNGTQNVFYKDPRVLFFSVHRFDFGSFYPGGSAGALCMIGEDQGAGYNINVPWEHGQCSDADYIAVWDHVLIPVAEAYNPDIVLISAGFDAAMGDPLGGCCITPFGYSTMLKKLMRFAGGKIVMALEGGYNLNSISNSVLACAKTLLEGKPIVGSLNSRPFEATWRVISDVRQELKTYWPIFSLELSPELLISNLPCPLAAKGKLRRSKKKLSSVPPSPDQEVITTIPEEIVSVVAPTAATEDDDILGDDTPVDTSSPFDFATGDFASLMAAYGANEGLQAPAAPSGTLRDEVSSEVVKPAAEAEGVAQETALEPTDQDGATEKETTVAPVIQAGVVGEQTAYLQKMSILVPTVEVAGLGDDETHALETLDHAPIPFVAIIEGILSEVPYGEGSSSGPAMEQSVSAEALVSEMHGSKSALVETGLGASLTEKLPSGSEKVAVVQTFGTVTSHTAAIVRHSAPHGATSLVPAAIPTSAGPSIMASPMTPLSLAEVDDYARLILETFYAILRRGVSSVLERGRSFAIAKAYALLQVGLIRSYQGYEATAGALEAFVGELELRLTELQALQSNDLPSLVAEELEKLSTEVSEAKLAYLSSRGTLEREAAEASAKELEIAAAEEAQAYLQETLAKRLTEFREHIRLLQENVANMEAETQRVADKQMSLRHQAVDYVRYTANLNNRKAELEAAYEKLAVFEDEAALRQEAECRAPTNVQAKAEFLKHRIDELCANIDQ